MKFAGWPVLLLLSALFFPAIVHAQVLQTLYNFKGENFDGAEPLGGLTIGPGTVPGSGQPSFYGTTYLGGPYLSGMIFRIDAEGHYKRLHEFRGRPADGAGPESSLTNVEGLLYGTTTFGGSQDFGTIFSVTAGGVYNHVYQFKSLADGIRPEGALLYANGTLYGTTGFGGARTPGAGGCLAYVACGTLFSIDLASCKTLKSCQKTVLHAFDGEKDGSRPNGNLVLVDNALYGVADSGGSKACYGGTGCGTIFRYSLDPRSKKKFSTYVFEFGQGNSNDGARPSFGLTYANGLLYGSTTQGGVGCDPFGCGVVFTLDPRLGPRSEKPIFSNFNISAGLLPSSGLTILDIANGSGATSQVAIGAALSGGQPSCSSNGTDCAPPSSAGTIYETLLAAPYTTKPIFAFSGTTNGYRPYGALVHLGQTVFGVTYGGGKYDSGTIFKLEISAP